MEMRNNTFFRKSFFALIIIAFLGSHAFAGDNNRPKLSFKKAEKLLAKKNALVGLDLDIQVGVCISKTNFELNKVDSSTQQLNSTSTKVGPVIGALLSVNFFGIGFTSGLQYSSKGFETTTGEKANLNYLNIPLLFYFDFDITEKVRVEGNLGPYFGVLLSSEDNPNYKIKNFDFGLTGNLQFAYMFNKFMGVLLGGKYEYGGLNNLGNNENIKRTTTSTINVYTGLKFEL
jgi:hypothetical protein